MGFEVPFGVFYKIRYIIFLVWVAVLIVCAFWAPEFVSLTNVNFNPPDSSRAAKATKLYKKEFPDTYNQARFMCLIKLKDKVKGISLLNDTAAINATKFLTNRVLHSASHFSEDRKLYVAGMGFYTFEDMYPANDTLTPVFLMNSFMSKGHRSTIILMTTAEKATQKSLRWVRYMRKEFDKILDKDKEIKKNFTLDIIGFDTLTNDMIEGTSADLAQMDSISLPIAIVLFVVILRSVIAAVVPIIAVVASIDLSFAIMNPICHAMDIPSFAPPVMMSITIAMSIDYCLFLLTRFYEELNMRNPPMLAAQHMVRYSGETIAKSGSVFLVCLASLTVFPLKIIVGVGIGAVVALVSTMLVALTFIPSIICIGLNVFSMRGIIPCVSRTRDGKCQARWICPCSKNAYKLTEGSDEYLSKKEKFEKEKKGLFFRWANWVTTTPHSVITIIVVLIIMLPFILGMIAFDYVINQDQVLPRNSETHDAIHRFSHDWSVGQLYSFDIIAKSKKENEIMFSEKYFDMMHSIAENITKLHNFNMSGILSATDMNEYHVNFTMAQKLLGEHNLAYSIVYSQMVNKNQTALRMNIAPNNNPNVNASQVPLDVRPILEHYEDQFDCKIYITNALVDMHDAVKYTFSVFPYIILAICGIIVIMVIVAFQAPILSLQMISTIGITVVWGFGVISIIFATGWFKKVSDNINSEPGTNWVVPVITLPVLIGLALDYNFFLFTRVHEFRTHGWSPRASVVRGVAKSTVVILYAGCIMAVAFAGLIASGLMMINQVGVLIALCVLLDTFAITTTLNPACFFLMNHLAYWPRKFPINYENPEVFNKDGEVDTTAGGDKPRLINPITETGEMTPDSAGGLSAPLLS